MVVFRARFRSAKTQRYYCPKIRVICAGDFAKARKTTICYESSHCVSKSLSHMKGKGDRLNVILGLLYIGGLKIRESFGKEVESWK